MNEKIQTLYKGLTGHEISYFKFLGDLAQKVKPNRVLEIGTGWALSSSALLLNSDATIVTIDKLDKAALKLFVERINLFNLWDRIDMRTGDSKEILPKFRETFDIVYVDGDHTYKGVSADFKEAARLVKKGGILLCDDIYHPLNWINRDEKEKEPEYGVAHAMLEWCKINEKNAEIYAVANGFGLIRM